MKRSVTVTVKFEGQTRRLLRGAAARPVSEVVTIAFVRAGWNGGAPPQNWGFQLRDRSQLTIYRVNKQMMVFPGDTIEVYPPAKVVRLEITSTSPGSEEMESLAHNLEGLRVGEVVVGQTEGSTRIIVTADEEAIWPCLEIMLGYNQLSQGVQVQIGHFQVYVKSETT